MIKLIRLFCFLSLVFSSFTIWFSLGAWLRLNFALLCVAIGLATIHALFSKKRIFAPSKHTGLQRLSIGLFLVWVIVTYVYHSAADWQPKLESNTLAIVLLVVIMYFLYSSLIEQYFSLEDGVRGLAWGSIVLMSVIATDSLLVNLTGIKIHDWFIWGIPGNTNYFYRGFWISPCSPTAEPGEAGQIMNVLIPFAVVYFKGKKRWMVCALYLFCLFSLFSSTTLLEFLLVPTALLFFQRKNKKYIIGYASFLIIGLGAFKVVGQSEDFKQAANDWGFVAKVTLSQQTASDTERQLSWAVAIDDALSHPMLGVGAGADKGRVDNRMIQGSYLSTWLAFWAYFGFIGITAFLIFWATFFFKIVQLDAVYLNVFLFSFMCNTINGVVGEYYPIFVFWAVLPFINKAYNNHLLSKIKTRSIQ